MNEKVEPLFGVISLTEFAVESVRTSDQSSATRWVRSHLFRHKLLILGVFIGAFGNAALAAVIPVLTGVAFNGILAEPPDVTLLGWVAAGVIISQIVRSFLQLGRNFSSAVMGERLERDMRQELYIGREN